MSKTAPVSVIIPCFRCTQTLERAIASVAAQSVLPSEVILVDDASGDNTRPLLVDIQNRYRPGWIKLILLDHNVGAGSSRNAGWALATQPLIAFLDADDAWHPNKIEIQYDFMSANPDVLMSGHEFRLLMQDILLHWELDRGIPQTVRKWRMVLKNQFVTPSVMVRRDIQHRFIERQRYMEDHMLWMRIVCTGARVVKLPWALAAIYKNPFGVTGLSSQIWLMERSDLGNYQRLYKDQYINSAQFLILILYSVLKYVRRLIIYTTYLRWKK